ncbi:transglycosylase SLT domain-containing protein [Rhizobacter sp. LjRoot28]|uniref:transglycosylase SLT domain-containing protein n=1 Tax=Rhizobacter sp. LjRoot28 TaxID=3342309 RepID=UPI003ECDF82E
MISLPSLRRPASFAALLLSLWLAGCATVAPPAEELPEDDVSDIVRAAESAASAAAASASAAAASSPASAASEPASAVAAPIDPLRPDEKVDLGSAAATVDLWSRLRRGFAIPDLDTPLVQKGEQYYAARPDYVQRMTTRGSRYLFHIVEEVERRGMPTELALLPFIESAFNPQAVSSAKASGMWQFMPATGKYFELRQNVFRDDRRDVLASTRAALDYLGKLYGMFGDWHLALAAYNWGEGSVQRAIRRNQRRGLPTDYLSLRMPDETQYYVPKLQAVKNLVARPSDFGITLPPLENHPYFLSVPIERDIDVALAVSLAGVSREEFQTLNPQMNKPVILAAGTPQLLLPYDNASQFIRNIGSHQGPLATWTAWVAPTTLHPSEAAKRVGMEEAELREVNKIPPSMLVRAGSTLLVPRASTSRSDVSPHIADNAVMSLTPDQPPLRRVSLRAGKRDTVASVARRYKVSPSQVANWNQVSAGARFKPGQTIVVYLAQKAVRGKAASVRAGARKGVVKATSAGKASSGSRKAASGKTAKGKKAAPAKKSVKNKR